MHRHRRENKVPSASKAERYARLKKQRGKSRKQHSEKKLMELLLLNCPDLPPCSYLIREGTKQFGPEYRNAQLFHPVLVILNTIVPSETTVLRHSGQCLCCSGVMQNVLCTSFILSLVQSDLCTLQMFLKEWDTQKYSKFVYDVQTSLLRLLVLLEVCTSRLSGNKEI